MTTPAESGADMVSEAQGRRAISAYESLVRFVSLPSQVLVVLVLEFLNSFRSYGLRFVLYNYVTNEFGVSDVRAGLLLGAKGCADIVFGLAGSVLVDVVGVRAISLASLAVAAVGRTLLAFGRSKAALYAALYLFSPCGDALLGIGLYRVALKKLSTPLTRPLAFSMSYAAANLAGGLADVVVDLMRKESRDVQLDLPWLGGVYTPMRQFVALTWLVVLLTLIIAYFFLEDWTVVDPDDLDADDLDHAPDHTPDHALDRHLLATTNSEPENPDDDDHSDSGVITRPPRSAIPPDAIPTKPMLPPRLLKRLFPALQHSLHSSEEAQEAGQQHIEPATATSNSGRPPLPPRYKMYRTVYAKSPAEIGSPPEANNDTPSDENNVDHMAQRTENTQTSRSPQLFSFPSCLQCASLSLFLQQLISILKLKNTWKVLIFGIASLAVSMQWTAAEVVLPAFLERHFGESTPIYTIQSINLFGCLLLPPVVGVFTTGREDFQIMLPGLWIMAISPIFVALTPNIAGVCVWQVFSTIGEVFWSPRQDSWTASLAPTGKEGLFFAASSARSLFSPLGDMVMGAMNDRYNTNCPDCRDQYGHFCDILSEQNGVEQCMSIQEKCDLFPSEYSDQQFTCPKTCLECPTWEPTNPSTFWFFLLLISITTPLLVWLFLPFFRGNYSREQGCFGIFWKCCSRNRLSGICGVPERSRGAQRHRIDENKAYGQLANKTPENSLLSDSSSVSDNGVQFV